MKRKIIYTTIILGITILCIFCVIKITNRDKANQAEPIEDDNVTPQWCQAPLKYRADYR